MARTIKILFVCPETGDVDAEYTDGDGRTVTARRRPPPGAPEDVILDALAAAWPEAEFAALDEVPAHLAGLDEAADPVPDLVGAELELPD